MSIGQPPGPAAHKKKPSVVRWFVLCVLTWIIAFGYMFVFAELTMLSHLTGTSATEVNATAGIELKQGQPFGLVATESSTATCSVSPEAGQPRQYLAALERSKNRSRPPVTDTGWFTGAATVRCDHPARFLPPDRYEYDQVGPGLMVVASLFLVIGVIQLFRRSQLVNRAG